MAEATQRTETDDLPAKVSAYERHKNHIAADLHPTIEMGDDYRDLKFNGPRNGKLFDDGDALIGFLERNRCPVCGERGTLRVSGIASYTFKKAVETRERTDDGWQENEAIRKLEANDYHPVTCKAPGEVYDFVVGIASPKAYEEWHEWKETHRERENFKSTARSLAHKEDNPEYIYHNGRTYSHGHLIAAIYEALGAENYDERDLMDRGHVRKNHLSTILERIKMLDWSEPKSVHTDGWIYSRDYGINRGRVEWHVPEWVDSESFEYSGRVNKHVFE